MSKPKNDKPNVMWLALTSVIVDPEIQSRIETDMEHCRFLANELEISGELKPILVFFDGNKYWLANGFHRHYVYTKAGRDQIRAIVVPGTRDNAVVESARKNDDASKGKTLEDKKKSVMMLLRFEEWRKKSATVIGNHCGLNPGTVVKCLAEYELTTNEKLPDVVETSAGKMRPRQHFSTTYNSRSISHTRRSGFRARLNGKTLYLGHDESKAKEILAAKIEFENTKVPSIGNLLGTLARRGIHFVSSGFNSNCRLTGLLGDGLVATIADLRIDGESIASIGRALLLREHHCPTGRAVVVCCPDDGYQDVLDLGRRLGVEFLTPDEFIASVKGDGEGEAGAAVVMK